MAAYKDLVGQKITVVTSNPPEPKTGQMWYNSTDGKLKGLGITSAWRSSSPLLVARDAAGSAGTFLKVNSITGSGTTAVGQLSFAAAGTSWQAVKTSGFTAVAGEGYFINTTSGAIEMDLPAGSIGDEISFIDYAGTFDSNALTIDQNGTEKIAGSTDPLTVSTERAANTLVYVDSTQGWLLKNN